MTKRSRRSRRNINRFRFETSLPPEIAMERLHNLSPNEVMTAEDHYRQTFQVESQRLDDSIYFEIQVMGSANFLPAMLGQIVRGQIRAIDSTRTLVEGELRYSALVKFIGLLFVTILGGGSILFFLSGVMPAEEFFTIVGVTAVGLILIRIFATGKGGRNLTIDQIEEQIRPRRRDQHPVHRRERPHVEKRSEGDGLAVAAEEEA